MAYSSAAYDLSLFETKELKKPEIKEIKALPKVKSKKRISPAKCVLLSLTLLSVFSLFLYSQVQLNESTAMVAQCTTKLEKAKNEEELLDVELERLLSVKNIENYAMNELGLCKPENYQIEYIKTEQENKIQVADENETASFIENIKDFFDGFFSFFK